MITELKERVAAMLDVTEIMDILGWETADLVELLEDEIAENSEAFERATR